MPNGLTSSWPCTEERKWATCFESMLVGLATIRVKPLHKHHRAAVVHWPNQALGHSLRSVPERVTEKRAKAREREREREGVFVYGREREANPLSLCVISCKTWPHKPISPPKHLFFSWDLSDIQRLLVNTNEPLTPTGRFLST